MTKRDVRLARIAKSALALAGAGMVLGSGHPARAQESEVAALRRQLEEMQARLDKLEAAQNTQTEADKAKPAATAKFPVTISGLVQVQGLSYFDQSNDSPRAQDTFRVRRGELQLSGQITPRITGLIKIDPAKAISLNRAGTAVNATSNILQDLQLSFLLRARGAGATASNLYVDAGQFKIPVGYESLLPNIAVETIERSLIFTGRDPFGGGYGDIRDTGLQLRGNFGSQVDFRLGAFNGMGDRQNAQALSSSKAYLGLLSFKPRGVPGLTLGLSGGTGNTGTGSPTTVGGVTTFPPRADRNLFNLFGAYKRDKLTLQAEYLTGKSQQLGLLGGSGFTARRDIRGYYGSVGYLFTPKIQGVFRYDFLDTDRNLDGDSTVRDLILGVNYFPHGPNTKVQVNLIRRNGANDNAVVGSATGSSDLRNDRTELRTQLAVAF